MKTLFHGTTYENYQAIVKNGFDPQNQIWNCSNNGEMYFYDLDKSEQDEEDEKESDCIMRAFENSQITASIQKSLSNKLIVFKIEIDEDYTEDDCSCENMADVATTVDVEDLNKYGRIVNIYESDNYSPHLSMFYIAGLVSSNDYINTYNLSDVEIEGCKAIAESEIYLENEFDWSELIESIENFIEVSS